jgi:hypothetical protein
LILVKVGRPDRRWVNGPLAPAQPAFGIDDQPSNPPCFVVEQEIADRSFPAVARSIA